ncbi:unnamed protein product [Strongylus vulgaris]|uniref:VWFA domain-containing protein n=1 Tax=Strongylus vulgaris TaxID=40348 RepID=A0A3P7JDR6_STRVU|nr:unnamed protein product [Strongylus vulgaris]
MPNTLHHSNGSDCAVFCDEGEVEPHYERDCPCTKSGIWLDVVAAIDVSKGMTYEGITQVIATLVTVFDPIKIAQGEGQHSRLSIITYGTNATIKFKLTDFKSHDEMMDKIWDIECTTDSKTNLKEGLMKTQEVFAKAQLRHDRDNVQELIIIFASEYK